MDKKRMKRSKAGGNDEEGMWDCSVCTYKNSTEAFKCAMCDVRKGTSTRKPKPNPQQLVAQQVAQQQQIAAASAAATAAKRERLHSATSSKRHSAAVSNTGDSTAGETDTSMDSTDAAAALHRNPRSLTPPTSAGHTSRSHLHPISTSTPTATHQKNKTDVSKKAQKTATTPHTAPHNSSGAVKRTASIAGLSLEVTVGDVTVIITDYKPKRAKEYLSSDSHTQSQDSLNQSQHEDCLVGGVKQENTNGSLVNHTSSGSVPDDSICDPAHGDSSSNTASSPSNTVNNISSSSVASSDCDTAPVEGKLAD